MYRRVRAPGFHCYFYIQYPGDENAARTAAGESARESEITEGTRVSASPARHRVSGFAVVEEARGAVRLQVVANVRVQRVVLRWQRGAVRCYAM